MRGIYIRRWIALAVLVLVCINIIGCGETVSGAGKDIRRVGKVVRTIFSRDAAD